MDRDRRNSIVLAGLAVILVALVGRAWREGVTPPPASVQPGTARRPDGIRPATVPPAERAPAVHLEALRAEQRVQPGEARRNLFRFKPKPASPPPGAGAARASLPAGAAPAVLPSGPPPPPIALKFIGIVEKTDKSERLAVLSDGRGVPISGKEGDIIEGRYRILRIGNESIEMAYLDGRGRQTIRLSGS